MKRNKEFDMASGMSDWEERGTVSSSWFANLISEALREDHDTTCRIQFTNYGLVVEIDNVANAPGPVRVGLAFFEPLIDDHNRQDKQSICWACQLGWHGRCKRPDELQFIDERIDDEAGNIAGPCLCDHMTRPLIWAEPQHDLEQQSDGYRLVRPNYNAIERAESDTGWDPTS